MQNKLYCDLFKWLQMLLSSRSEFIKVTGYSTFVLLLKENKSRVGGESGGGCKGATNPRIG